MENGSLPTSVVDKSVDTTVCLLNMVKERVDGVIIFNVDLDGMKDRRSLRKLHLGIFRRLLCLFNGATTKKYLVGLLRSTEGADDLVA